MSQSQSGQLRNGQTSFSPETSYSQDLLGTGELLNFGPEDLQLQLPYHYRRRRRRHQHPCRCLRSTRTSPTATPPTRSPWTHQPAILSQETQPKHGKHRQPAPPGRAQRPHHPRLLGPCLVPAQRHLVPRARRQRHRPRLQDRRPRRVLPARRLPPRLAHQNLRVPS